MKKFSEEKYVSQEAINLNIRELHSFRTVLSIVGGIVTGLIGVNGMYGFLLFLVYSLFGSALLWIKYHSVSAQYFTSSKWMFIGWSDGMMGYLLFWILVHNSIYILS
jgi:hypothetical protein